MAEGRDQAIDYLLYDMLLFLPSWKILESLPSQLPALNDPATDTLFPVGAQWLSSRSVLISCCLGMREWEKLICSHDHPSSLLSDVPNRQHHQSCSDGALLTRFLVSLGRFLLSSTSIFIEASSSPSIVSDSFWLLLIHISLWQSVTLCSYKMYCSNSLSSQFLPV